MLDARPQQWGYLMAVALHQVKTATLKNVCDYLQAEIDSCDGGIAPDDKPAFEALLRMVERELWKRPRFRKAWRDALRAPKKKRALHMKSKGDGSK
jgi:hypothetical protein